MKPDVAQKQAAADRALQAAQEDYSWLKQLRPKVDQLVQAQKRLQKENHFRERVILAYRGKA